MTSDLTATSEPSEALPPAETVDVGASTRPYAAVSIAFFVLSLVLGALAALQLLVPQFLGGISVLSYGRIFPIATNAFIYGWLTIGLAGALLYVVGRTGGVGIPGTPAARGALGLMALGVLAGSVGIAVGLSEGRLYLEYPLWADAIMLGGFVALAATIGRMTKRSTSDPGPVRWYANAAAWWLVLAFFVGNVPGVSGVAGAFQTSFFRASLLGLWLATGAVAVVYHVIPRVAGRKAFVPTRLTVLGFWSLTFTWPFTAAANLTYSPAPDWLETIGAVFSFGLLLAPMIILSDLLIAMRGRWSVSSGSVIRRFVLLGGAMLALYPLASLALAIRSSSGLLQFTDWVGGVEALVLYGAISSWLAAFLYLTGPDLFRGAARTRLASLHYYGTVLGLLLWIGSSLLAGLTAGWTWVATANEAAVPAAGVGFSNTLAGVEGFYIARFIGFVVFAVAQLVFVANVLTGRESLELPAEAEPAVIDDELVLDGAGPHRLRLAVVAMFVVAGLFVWLVPWAETAGAEATILADSDRRYRSAGDVANGREIYLQEGCWYCHTQQVRPIVADVGLGPVSEVGDYVYETPVLFGVQRIGPDLMHVGSRPQTDDPAWVAGYLADPRSERSYSIMPAYDYLSDSELNDLAAYISASR